MRRLHILWLVIKRSGALSVLLSFLAAFVICGILVQLFEPGIDSLGDALWFLWAVSTTVGLGDFTAVTLVGRVAAVTCSIFAIVTTALTTGVIVDFFNEVRQHQLDESVTEMLDKLERLPELSKEELTVISDRVRSLRG